MAEVTYSVHSKYGPLWQVEGEFNNEKDARKCLDHLANLFDKLGGCKAVRLVKTVTTYTVMAHINIVEGK